MTKKPTQKRWHNILFAQQEDISLVQQTNKKGHALFLYFNACFFAINVKHSHN